IRPSRHIIPPPRNKDRLGERGSPDAEGPCAPDTRRSPRGLIIHGKARSVRAAGPTRHAGSNAGARMLFSERSIWTMVHGIAFGGAALLALGALLFSLY